MLMAKGIGGKDSTTHFYVLLKYLLTNLDHANNKAEHQDNPSVCGEFLEGMGN